MTAEEVLARIVAEANVALLDETPRRDLRWAVACHAAERMAALCREDRFPPLDLAEHFLRGLVRDFPGGPDDTPRGNAVSIMAGSLLEIVRKVREQRTVS